MGESSGNSVTVFVAGQRSLRGIENAGPDWTCSHSWQIPFGAISQNAVRKHNNLIRNSRKNTVGASLRDICEMSVIACESMPRISRISEKNMPIAKNYSGIIDWLIG